MYIFLALALWLTRWLDRSVALSHARGKACRPPTARNAPKPAWVREEILCLNNAKWGLDLTSLRGGDGQRYWILGIVEYCSRALLVLIVLVRKTAAALARALARVFEEFGPPQALVTDNEGPFRSGVWKRLLARFGVRHRRIAPYCPWQNGRIERFFGTLKRKLKQRDMRDLGGLQQDLDAFRHWYNCVRPHQALSLAIWNGAARLNLTPSEAWHLAAGNDQGIWFEGWNGILRGYSCRI